MRCGTAIYSIFIYQ